MPLGRHKRRGFAPGKRHLVRDRFLQETAMEELLPSLGGHLMHHQRVSEEERLRGFLACLVPWGSQLATSPVGRRQS